LKLWQIVIGIVLFLLSSFVAEMAAAAGISIMFQGQDYAVDVTTKVLDVLAGSLLVWGVLDLKKGKRK
jgi:uncharacterized membrane protein YjjP (DUF1212 family)